jgi:hypothetical protein
LKKIILQRSFWVLLGGFLAVWLFPVPSSAINLYWRSATTSNWNTGGNWSLTSGGASCGTNCVPRATHTVVFDGGGVGTCNINVAVTVTSFTINAGYTGTVATQNNIVTISSNFVQNAGTFSAGSSSITARGSWTLGASATFTAATSTVAFNSPNAGMSITSSGGSFAYVLFNGTGTWALLDALTVGSTVTFTGGTLSTGANYPITVAGSWFNSGGNFVPNSSTVTFTGGTPQKIRSNGKNFSSIEWDNAAGSWVLIDSMTITRHALLTDGTVDPSAGFSFIGVAGNWINTGGNFTIRNSTVIFNGATANSITSNGRNFPNVQFANAAGSWVLVDSMTVISSMTLTSGRLDTSASNWGVLVGGSWYNTGGNFTANGSTVSLTATSAGQRIRSGGKNFATLQLSGAGGTWMLIDSMTVTASLLLAAGTLNTNTSSQGMSVGYDWVNTGGAFTVNNSTVIFTTSGMDSHIRTRGFRFNRLTILGAGGYWVLQDSMTVSTVTVNSGGTLDLAGYDVNTSSLSITGHLIMRGTETVTRVPTLVANSSVTYSGTSGSPVLLSSWVYRNLIIDGAGETFNVAGGSLTIMENLRLTAGAVDATTNNYTIGVGGDWINTGGNFIARASTVAFTSTTNETIESDGKPFANVFFSAAGTWVLVDSMTVTSTMTWSAGTLNTSTSHFGVTVGGGWVNNGGNFIPNQSTVTFTATTPQRIRSNGRNFSSVAWDGAGGSWLLIDSMTLTADAFLTAGTLNTTTSNFPLSIAGSWVNTGGAFIANASTVTFNATVPGEIITSDGNNFSYVAFSGSGGYWTLQDSMTVTSSMTISAGTLDPSVSNHGILLAGSWYNTGGDFIARQSTLTFTATTAGQRIRSAGEPFGNVHFNGSGGTWVLIDSMTVTSTMTIAAGTFHTSATGNFGLSVGGNWTTTGAGTFTVNQSTVTFIGTSGQIVRNAGQAFRVIIDSNTSSGGIVFASSFTALRLTVDSLDLGSGTTLYFNAGSTYTITHLELTGAPGDRVWMRSTQSGTSWLLNNSGTNSAAYVDVRDSDARAGNQIIATNSINSGNNLNWSLGGVGQLRTWLGGASGNWFIGSNWDTGVPASQDSALIEDTGFMPTLTGAVSISTLTITAGSSVTLAGFNLTLSSFTNAGAFAFNGSEAVSRAPHGLAGSTVTYAGASGTLPVLSTWTYRNLWIRGGTGATFAVRGGSLTVDESLTITAGTLDTTTNNYQIGVSSSWINNGGGFVARSSTVTLTGSAPGLKIVTRGFPFSTLEIEGPGYWTMADSMTISMDMLLEAGTLDASASNLAIGVGGSWLNTGSTFLPNASTVTFTAAIPGELIASNGSNFSYVAFTGAGYWTLQDSMTVVSTMTLAAGTLDTSGSHHGITVGGSWNNTGAQFIPNLSTVTFTASTAGQRIRSNGRNFAHIVWNNPGTWVLIDSMTVTQDAVWNAGTLNTTTSNFPISVGGSWLNSGGSFIPNASTVTFTGATPGEWIESNGKNFSYLAFSGSGYWTLVDSMTVVSTITLTAGVLDTSPSNWAMRIQGSWLNNGGTVHMNDSTVTFAATTAGQRIRSGGDNFPHVQFNGTGGVWVLQDSMTVTGDILLAAGALNTGSSQGIGIGSDWINTGGVFQVNNSTVSLNGTTAGLGLRTRGQPFRMLWVGPSTSGGYYVMQDSMTVSTATVYTGDTLESSGYGINTSSLTNAGTLVIRGTETITKVVNNLPGSTVVYNAPSGSPVIMSSWTYRNLTIDGGTTFNVSGGSLTIQDDLQLEGGVLDATANNYTLGVAGDWVNAGGGFTARASTVAFTATGNQTITSAGKPFANVLFSGAGTWVLVDSMTVTSTMTWTAGTLNTSASDWGITVGGSWNNQAGAFILNDSTVTFTATTAGQKIRSSGDNFASIYFNGAGGTWVLQDSMTVVSTMTLGAGTLNTNTTNLGISIGGDWLNPGGTFVANQSTVTFNGATGQRVHNNGQAFAVVIGSNTSSGGLIFSSSFSASRFYVNGAGLASATTIYFNSGSTFTITSMYLRGAAGSRVWMRPTAAGQTWLLRNTSTNTVSYVDVAYSSASAGVAIVAGPTSVDSGGNMNWTFAILSVSISPASYDFTTVNLGGTTLSVSAVNITNSGDGPQTYSLSVATTGASVWGVGTATPTVMNTFVLEGLFNSVQPSTSTFTHLDVITSTPTAASASVYAGNQSGAAVAAGAVRPFWMLLFMPPSTTTTSQQSMSVTVSAATP